VWIFQESHRVFGSIIKIHLLIFQDVVSSENIITIPFYHGNVLYFTGLG
jgi:hypothetical protein